MPTRTQQSDLLACAYASHGDTKHVLLLPQDPHECFEHAAAALDLADRLQTPIFVMTDLDIGMNQRLCKPFVWDDARRYDRGKVMTAEELEAGKDFGRYKDVDGDGIPWRTLPGTHPTKGAFFTRGTTRDPYARYSERGPDYIYNMERLLKKFATAATLVPQPVLRRAAEPTRVGVIYFGSTSPAMREALDVLEAEDVHLDALRLCAFPFPKSVHRLHRGARQGVRGRAEPRRADALAARQRARRRSCAAGARAALRRHADHGALHRRGDPQGDDPAQGVRMTFIAKPRLHHPTLHVNKVGYTRRDYEGRISTLCAGCGHDSISAAIIQACWELDIEPHRVAKLSGIGCSSKTPDYFLGASHGFNTVHGRMPSVLTGANLANRDLLYLGVSGDGDSASIGLGQFANAMRRGVRMAYIVENNGVYGLTKGQFSATADQGSKSKKGVVNNDSPVDLVGLALQLGATYVARSFSGDKEQLVPLIKGAMAHGGAAFIDVISPCVTFNNHGGSTKSYDYVRQHNEAVSRIDFITPGQRDHHRLRTRRGGRSDATTTARCCACASCTATTTHRPLRRDELHARSTRRTARWSPVCSTWTRWPPTCTRRSTPAPRRSPRWARSSCAPAPRCWRRSTPRCADALPTRPDTGAAMTERTVFQSMPRRLLVSLGPAATVHEAACVMTRANCGSVLIIDARQARCWAS